MMVMGSDWSGAAFFGPVADVSGEQIQPDLDMGNQSEELFISGKQAQLPVWFLQENETEDLKSDERILDQSES